MSDKLPVFVVEDQAPTLRALVKLLGTYPDLEVVGSAMSGEAAREELPKSGARVALVDVELPGIDGLELVAQLKGAHVTCELLMLTSFVSEEKVMEAMRRGASGYLVKGVPGERLHAALHEVDRGGTVIEPRLAKAFWATFRGLQQPLQEAQVTITPDEAELLVLVGKGLSNAEAGEVLGVARRNVRTRLQKIYDKLGARSHVDAVMVALKRGLIQL
jgi:DNA-binding NarL/FixJ family response regulator